MTRCKGRRRTWTRRKDQGGDCHGSHTALTALKFSPFPCKWIRYAMVAIVGAEGHLSYDHDLGSMPEQFDYAHPLPGTGDHHLYYHVPEEQLSTMLSLDLGYSSPRPFTTSEQGSQMDRLDFKAKVMERDNRECIVNVGASEDYCEAAHIVPYGKGSKVCIRLSRFADLD